VSASSRRSSRFSASRPRIRDSARGDRRVRRSRKMVSKLSLFPRPEAAARQLLALILFIPQQCPSLKPFCSACALRPVARRPGETERTGRPSRLGHPVPGHGHVRTWAANPRRRARPPSPRSRRGRRQNMDRGRRLQQRMVRRFNYCFAGTPSACPANGSAATPRTVRASMPRRPVRAWPASRAQGRPIPQWWGPARTCFGG
jgi:hypothetical protein